VEDSEDEYIGSGYFVANFVVSYQKPAYLAGLEFRQPGAKARIKGNSFYACDQLANHANRGGRVNGIQEFVQANEV
jgi:hypothetical protein